MANSKSNITRKIVGNKVYTYNGSKLIHVTDRGTGTGTGTNNDITKNNNKNNTVKNNNKNNNSSKKNADGTWKNQTMVTGAMFGAQSNQQQKKQQTQTKSQTTAPAIQAPQVKQISVSNNKNTSMRERIADKNKGKVAVAGKGYVQRKEPEKTYSSVKTNAVKTPAVKDTDNAQNVKKASAREINEKN